MLWHALIFYGEKMTELQSDEIYKYFHENARNLLDRYLPPAKKNGEWICPICGKGQHGDGIKLDPKRAGVLHCYSGRHSNGHPAGHFDGDIIDLIGEEYGITDQKEMRQKACEIFGITVRQPDRAIGWNDSIQDDAPERPAPGAGLTAEAHKMQKMAQNPHLNEKSQKDYDEEIINALNGQNLRFKEFITTARQNLNDPRAQEYLRRRGISNETAEHFGIGYIEHAEIDGMQFYNSLVFPSSMASFATRIINPSGTLKSLKPKGARDIPFGLQRLLLSHEKNKRYGGKYAINEPVFVVEGLLDAPSIYEAGGDAIALNGTGTIKPVIDAFKYYGIDRPIILALDSDEAGRSAAERIYKTLKDAEMDVYKCELIPDGMGLKDANELLMANKELLKKAVAGARKLPVAKFEKNLNKNRRREFLDSIAASARTPAVATGFPILDSRDFLDGGLYPGLYVIGAISSLGKTAFTLQLADQIAAAGHDVLYLSLEMGANELISRSVSRYTAAETIENGLDPKFKGRTIRDISDGRRWNYYTAPAKEEINDAINQYFNDTGETLRIIEGIQNMDAGRIRAMVAEYVKYTGRAPVVILDYLQLLQPPKDEDGRTHAMTDKQITDKNVYELKLISRDFNTPVFAISSFNRSSYYETVSMASFKESGAIEYGTDVLITLTSRHQHDKEKRELEEAQEQDSGIRRVELKILKNRSGQRGGTICYDYYFRYNFFKEIADKRNMANIY